MFNLFKSQHAKTISPATKEEVLLFDENLVSVEREAFRRRLSLSVALNDKIRVRAAKPTTPTEILQFLELQKEWISARLVKNSNIRIRYPKKAFTEGERFLFFGSHFRLKFEEAAAGLGQIFLRDENLVVGVPSLHKRGFRTEVAHPEMAKPIRDFYRHQGRSFIETQTQNFAKKMQLFPKDLSFRSQKTRWGSCSTSGHVSFNWRLIIAPKEVIEYVIVHELAHLKHHNHSKNFWNLVATQLPNYPILRKWLHDHQFEADFLAKKSELWID